MTDRERISNLEEMVAEVFIRLDKLESILKNMPSLKDSKKYDFKSLDEGLRELAKNQLTLNDRQDLVEKSFVLLTEICRRNSEAIEATRNSPREKYDNAELFEFLMAKFDKIDERFCQIEARITKLEERLDHFEKQFKSEIESIKKRLDNNPS